MKIFNQPIIWQQLNAYRRGQVVQLLFRPNFRMGKKCHFDRRIIIGARQDGLSISESTDLLGYSRPAGSRVCRECCRKTKHPVSSSSVGKKHLVNERGQRRRARQVAADRKVTVTQITMHYNSGMQKSTSEHTMCQTSNWIGYSGRRPISLKNKSNKY